MSFYTGLTLSVHTAPVHIAAHASSAARRLLIYYAQRMGHDLVQDFVLAVQAKAPEAARRRRWDDSHRAVQVPPFHGPGPAPRAAPADLSSYSLVRRAGSVLGRCRLHVPAAQRETARPLCPIRAAQLPAAGARQSRLVAQKCVCERDERRRGALVRYKAACIV
jgi:hypothetical protein